MGKFSEKTISNQAEHGASAFIFDLRNSTKITRSISFDKRLIQHVEFMKNLHKFVYLTIYGKLSTSSNKDEFAINDTGDGYICVFWNKIHSITCMHMAIKIRNYLSSTLPTHNIRLGDIDHKLAFGFAAHTGGVTVERINFNDRGGKLIHKDFILGILPNSVSRLESLNKFFIETNFIVSGNYKTCFDKHAHSIGNVALENIFDIKRSYVNKSPSRVNINDGKSAGHNIYTLKDEFFDEFTQNYK
jgi:hypothetical protein